MGAMRKTMQYFGFDVADRDEYEDYADEDLAPVTNLHDVAAVRDSARTGAHSRVSGHEAGGELRRIRTINPRVYADARQIGEAFRQGVPVIMNLTEMSDSDSRRLVDFAAGLSFGLHGSLERVTTSVFLLSPAHVEIAMDATPEPQRDSFFA